MEQIEGRYETIRTAEGTEAPWYVLPFDAQGRCEAPRTREALIATLGGGETTHVFLFCHGWNNDWRTASERYRHFIDGFLRLRAEAGLPPPPGYRPLLIGVFWPSTSLVLPWERGPRFAGAGASASGADRDAFAEDLERSVDALTEALPEDSRPRFHQLVQAETLDADGVGELAALLAPVLASDAELPAGDAGPPDRSDLAKAWLAGAGLFGERSSASDDEDDEDEEFGVAAPVSSAAAPVAAGGLLGLLDPRHAVRMATVWLMKDRAGVVGAHGVHSLLREVLERSRARVHLVGHSYGCKVVLSAVAAGPLARPVASALLLQPAISHLAFARDADGKGRPGGYRAALERIQQPVLCTFSSRDFPLSRVFHLAVRRRTDLGEQRIAAGAPSRYAALGGYGPRGMDGDEAAFLELKEPGQAYDEIVRPGLEVLALNGSRQITGHGDIEHPSVYWALQEQVRLGSRGG